MTLRLVERRSMKEHTGVLTEVLAVVRGKNQPGTLEDRLAPELVDQHAQLLIEFGDAVVVGIASKGNLLGGSPLPDHPDPIFDVGHLTRVAWPDTKAVNARLRKLIRIMSIIVIQEREERPLLLRSPRKPVKELAISRLPTPLFDRT